MRIEFNSESYATHFQYDIEDNIGIEVLRRGYEAEITVNDLTANELFRIETIASDYGGRIIEP